VPSPGPFPSDPDYAYTVPRRQADVRWRWMENRVGLPRDSVR
jgi:hypothetical protein